MTQNHMFSGLLVVLALSATVPCHAASISGDGLGVTKTDSRSTNYIAPSGTNAMTSGGVSDSYVATESTTHTANDVGTPQEQPTEGEESDSNDAGGSGGGTTQQDTAAGGGRRATTAGSSSRSSIAGETRHASSRSSAARLPHVPDGTRQGPSPSPAPPAQALQAAIVPTPTASPMAAVSHASSEIPPSADQESTLRHGAPSPAQSAEAVRGSVGSGTLAVMLVALLVALHRGRGTSAGTARRRKQYRRLAPTFVLLLMLAVPAVRHRNTAHASTIPDYMLYEGTLSDGSGNAVTTARTFRFSLWKSADWESADQSSGAINTDASNYGGWQETKSYTPSTTGFFSIQLGETNALPAFDADTHAYLQVEVKAFGAADTTYELIDVNATSDTVDRKYLSVIPYAKNAAAIDGRQIGTGSGNIILLGSGGSMTVNGVTTVNADVTVRGNLSGSTLHVDGAASLNSTLAASGSITTKSTITINAGNANQDATLTFGNNLAAQTLRFNASRQRFEFSKDIAVRGTMSGSTLNVDGTSTLQGATTINGKVNIGPGSTSSAQLRFGSGSTVSSPLNGDIWYDKAKDSLGGYFSGITQFWTGVIFTQTADKTVSNTLTATSLIGTGTGTVTLPANFFKPGKTVRIRASGVYSTLGLTPGTLTIVAKLGSTTVGTAVIALPTAAVSEFWTVDETVTCRSTGATGTVMAVGTVLRSDGNASNYLLNAKMTNAAATTIDTTSSQTIDVTATFSVQSASNTITTQTVTVDVLH